MDSNNICTIIAKNYISFARTLCDSFLEHHPDGKCFVLIIDDIDGYVDLASEPFAVLSATILEIPDWPDFSFKYDITELATALKPYLLAHLLQKDSIDRILYIDPDILILRPLTELYERLEDKGVLLTPHLDTDFPDDGCLPNDAHIMKSGIYNLGFIGVGDSSDSLDFLRWWQRKLYDRCVIDHAEGYFVDQKFIDYALPLFGGFQVISDTGYNVAYWNIHSRTIEWNEAEWTCNGSALYFYHFSGFKIAKPDQISVYQNRCQLSELPGLHKLFKHYVALLQQNGLVETGSWPYTFNTYHSGVNIYRNVRRLYREFRDKPIKDPFGSSNLSIVLSVSPKAINVLFGKGQKFIGKLYSRFSG